MYLEEERNRELEALFEADVERGADGRGKLLSASKAVEGEEGGELSWLLSLWVCVGVCVGYVDAAPCLCFRSFVLV